MVSTNSSPFGSATRTRVLLTLSLLGESYARELTRLLGARLSGVQKALQSLERDGIVAGRLVGRTRVFQLDPRYFARDPLKLFLRRLAEPELQLHGQIEVGRRVAGPVRLALQVDDSAATAQRLAEAGGTIVGGPVVTPWNDRNVRLDPPEGVQLTLFTTL